MKQAGQFLANMFMLAQKCKLIFLAVIVYNAGNADFQEKAVIKKDLNGLGMIALRLQRAQTNLGQKVLTPRRCIAILLALKNSRNAIFLMESMT